jgi:hypothetical protein
MALSILLVAGLLADEHHESVASALAEHRLRRVSPQRAGTAVGGLPPERGERSHELPVP